MDLEKKIREYREYTRLIEEATATRDAIEIGRAHV